MSNGFTFGEKSTKDFGMHVEKFPALNSAMRKYTAVSVPGRSGTLHMDEGAFENYQQSYECYFHGDKPAPEAAHAIKAWLLSGEGYRKLQDVYDPEHYRMAYFAGPLDVDNRLNRYGKCVVNFDCAPQAYLVIGDEVSEFTAAGVITNPTAFDAEPIIHVYGSGSGSVSVNGTTVQILEITDVITLDCQMQNAYRQLGDSAAENKNSVVSASVFPKLSPGDNGISFDGGITKVEIIPRWWEV